MARALRGPVVAAAAGPLQSWPSSCRSLARSFLAVALDAVPLAVPVPVAAPAAAAAVGAGGGRSSCTSSILRAGVPGVSPRSPHSPWPHCSHRKRKRACLEQGCKVIPGKKAFSWKVPVSITDGKKKRKKREKLHGNYRKTVQAQMWIKVPIVMPNSWPTKPSLPFSKTFKTSTYNQPPGHPT